MKHIKLYEQFVNEEAKPEILVKLFKELAKAKNVEKVIWGYDKSEEFPHVVHFVSGLESQADRHEGEMEEFSFYLNDDGQTILGIYDLSGYDQELKTVKDAVNWCRANEKQLSEKFINEGHYSSSDIKKLKALADKVSDEINDDYADQFDRKSSGLDADDYSPEAMLDYIKEWGEGNNMTAAEVIDEFDWKHLESELGLR
jgi:hypothetical protein